MAYVNNDPAPSQPKILLVDDREDNLLSIEAILAPDGYQFFRAYSGHQALKILLNEFNFAMILMDVKMPILNGFETATLIHEREKLRHVPIIFITANNYGDENIFKGYQAGGIDYIFKPINPEVLRAKVSVFIDLYRKNGLLFDQEQKLALANSNLEREIIDLKASEEKVKRLNVNLRKEISNLESLVVSKLQIDRSEFVQCDLNGLVKSLLSDMEDQVKEKMATILIEPLPTLEVSPILMRPLFQHLIRNALHDSKKDTKPVIRIRSEKGKSNEATELKSINPADYCHIIVENNGQRFDQQISNESSAPLDRSHLNGEVKDIRQNLAFCEKIMEKHGGFISVKDEVSDEPTLIISFPQAK